MKKRILTILLTLLLIGCSSKQLYTLGDTSHIRHSGESTNDYIAIEKIELPIYFMDSPIYIKDTPYHLKEIENANWINNMDKHLTNVLISYLQKSMNNPNIYKYPWSNIKNIDKRISITISSFIAYKGVVTLDANYHITDKSRYISSNHIFNTKVSFKDESIEKMIEAMEKAYFSLIKNIKDKL